MELKDVLRSIIIEANPSIPNYRVEELIKKYEVPVNQAILMMG